MNVDILKQVSTIGRAAAHTLFPNDFEYYAVTIELTDSKGKTIEYLTFPVSPDSISYDDQTLVNIKKTLGGISTTDSNTNRPKKITLSGSFGRKIRLLTELNNVGHSGSTRDGVYSSAKEGLQTKSRLLSLRLKTGYGVTKILKSIVDRSSELDSYNETMNVYLYFPILGENYLVRINSFKLIQDVTSSNMMWKYTLNLTVVANLDEIRSQNGVSRMIANSAIQKGVGILLNKVRKLI